MAGAANDKPRDTGSDSDTRPGLAYVVNSLNTGGTEKLVVEMALAFAEAYRVVVICLDEPGRWAEVLRVKGIAVHCVWRAPGFDVRMLWRLAALFRAEHIDIVHAHQCTAWFYSALARLLHAHPQLLLEEHGRFYPEPDSALRRWVNRLVIAPLTARCVAVSRDVKLRLHRYEGLRPAHIEVIYNGVPPETPLDSDARRALRHEWGFADDDFVVGTVGRFDPIKNLPMLVDAIAEARAGNPHVRGFLVGHGPEYDSIRALIEQRGLQDVVPLPGFRDDARTLVQAMDLFVLSSLSEGTSMALLEGMRAGVPVAVTAVGGNPEIVLAGETGWVVPSGATDALAAVIQEAVADPVKRTTLAAAGQARFTAAFTLDAMISRYRELYAALSGSAAHGARE